MVLSGLCGFGKERTSAASAAFLLASSCAPPDALSVLPPSVRAGPPTFRGTLDLGAEVVVEGGGAEERVRPGWLKGEGSEVLQQLPILGD